MKVNEGDYVRTRDGIIDEVIIDYNGYCNNSNCNCKHVSCKHNYYDEDRIIKSSPDIKDLIEVGDYVNGYKISKIVHYADMGTALESEFIDYENYGNKYIKCFGKKNIKSIVTKEQFESCMYKVGE